MDLIQLLVLIVMVGICGAIAEWIVGFKPGGLMVTIIVGVVGAFFGGWIGGLLRVELPLFSLFNAEVGAISFNLLWSVIGSILLLLLLNLLRGGFRGQPLRRP